jgi:hypothetical protein
VKPEAIERFWAEQSFGADQVLMLLPTRFSMGFMLSQPGMRFKPWAGRGMKQDLVRTGYTGAVAGPAHAHPDLVRRPRRDSAPSSNGSPTSPIRKPAASVRTTVDDLITFAGPTRTR